MYFTFKGWGKEWKDYNHQCISVFQYFPTSLTCVCFSAPNTNIYGSQLYTLILKKPGAGDFSK